jgi:hypothetical protein
VTEPEPHAPRKWLAEAIFLGALPFVTCSGFCTQAGYASYFGVPIDLVPLSGAAIFGGFLKYALLWVAAGTILLVGWVAGSWLTRHSWIRLAGYVTLGFFVVATVVRACLLGMKVFVPLFVLLAVVVLLVFVATLFVTGWRWLAALHSGGRPAPYSYDRDHKALGIAYGVVSWLVLAFATGLDWAANQEDFYVLRGDKRAVAAFTSERAICFRWTLDADGTRRIERDISFVLLDNSAVFERRHLGVMSPR